MEEATEKTCRACNKNVDLLPTLLWRFLLAAVEPPGLKGFAPEKLRPASSLNPESTLAALIKTHDQLRSIAARCREPDVNRLTFRHPFLYVDMSVASGFLLKTAHERRHLWQGERVAAACHSLD